MRSARNCSVCRTAGFLYTLFIVFGAAVRIRLDTRLQRLLQVSSRLVTLAGNSGISGLFRVGKSIVVIFFILRINAAVFQFFALDGYALHKQRNKTFPVRHFGDFSVKSRAGVQVTDDKHLSLHIRSHLIIRIQFSGRNPHYIVEYAPIAFTRLNSSVNAVHRESAAIVGFRQRAFFIIAEPSRGQRGAQTIAQTIEALGNRAHGNLIGISAFPWILHIFVNLVFKIRTTRFFIKRNRGIGFFPFRFRQPCTFILITGSGCCAEYLAHRPVVRTGKQAGENPVEEALQQFVFPLNPVPFTVELRFPFHLGAFLHHVPPPGFFAVESKHTFQIAVAAAGAEGSAGQTADFTGFNGFHLGVHQRLHGVAFGHGVSGASGFRRRALAEIAAARFSGGL